MRIGAQFNAFATQGCSAMLVEQIRNQLAKC